MIRDDYCRQCIEKCPGVAVAWWLMASYAYYEHDDPILSDACFDWVNAFLMANPDVQQRHWHGGLITDGMLLTGSGHSIKAYPGITKAAADRHRRGEKVS